MTVEQLRHRPTSLAEVKTLRNPVRHVNRDHAEALSPLERLALFITEHVGTMGFFLIVLVWTVLWLGWNLLAPESLQFDKPMGFVFWLFISNMLQIFLMPLIMIGQNIQGWHAELRAESEYETSIKAEREVEVILEHLEYQNRLLLALAERLGVQSSPEATVASVDVASSDPLSSSVQDQGDGIAL
jgi:uncharacterized membrane protein